MLVTLEQSEQANVVLAGGSSPRKMHEIAAQGEPSVFEGATFWLGDERCAGPEDELSNFRMISDTLLTPLTERGVHFTHHRIRGEDGPTVAALAYERELADAGPPTFDLLFIGVGPDAHILSLFPGQSSLHERERLVVGVPEAGMEPFVPRVSMTLAACALARHVVVLATGSGKAQAIARAFAPDAEPSFDAPASLLRQACAPGTLTVMLDQAAAGLL